MMSFASVSGHEDIKLRLQENLSSGRIGHAYIFEGEDATGRDALAEAFAAALLCEKGGKEACGNCRTCAQVAGGNCLDLIYVTEDPEKKKKTGIIGVKEVRGTLVDQASVRPFAARYKVFLMKDAQNMTTEAQNALLKMLEEPPEYVIIILVCDDADHLLPTVRSRAEIVEVGALSEAAIRKALVREGLADPEKAAMCAALAAGDLGAAEALASSENFDRLNHEVCSALRNMEQMSIRRVHDLLFLLKDHKENADLILRIMRVWYRDVLLFKATRDVRSISLADEYRHISRCAAENDYLKLEKAIQDVEKAQTRLNANVNNELTMELLLLSLKENIK